MHLANDIPFNLQILAGEKIKINCIVLCHKKKKSDSLTIVVKKQNSRKSYMVNFQMLMLIVFYNDNLIYISSQI